ncbi:MAG: hypothetical protein RLN75_09420, partial [Longimicrobiales bacterium]
PAAPPSGFPSGLNAGIIAWGDAVTDVELPDLVYPGAAYEVRLSLQVSNGRIRYGPAETSPLLGPAGWTGTFLGPSSVADMMERFAERLLTEEVLVKLRASFNTQTARDRLAEATWERLQAQGVSELLALERGADGALRFVYR